MKLPKRLSGASVTKQWKNFTYTSPKAPDYAARRNGKGGVLRMARCRIPKSKSLEQWLQKRFSGFGPGSWFAVHKQGTNNSNASPGPLPTTLEYHCDIYLVETTCVEKDGHIIEGTCVSYIIGCLSGHYVAKEDDNGTGGGSGYDENPCKPCNPDQPPYTPCSNQPGVPTGCSAPPPTDPCRFANPPDYCQGNPCITAINELAEATQLDSKSQDVQKEFTNMLNQYAGQFDIDNKYKLQHLIAQADIESGGFTDLTENISRERAKKLYGHRSILANNNDGDGYKYRGRGILQLTGKDNYKHFTEFYDSHFNSTLDFVENPGLIGSNPKLAVISGLWYFKYRVMADVDIDGLTSSKEITKQINPFAKPDDIANRKETFDAVKKVITECK